MIFLHRGRLIDRNFKELAFERSCQLKITFKPIEGTPDEHIILNREEILSILNSILELTT